MVIEWVAIGIQTALIAAVLAGFMLVFKRKALTWINMGIARFMKNLSKQAADEEGNTTSPSGAFNIGGFKITPELVQMGLGLLKSLREGGILKGGGSGGGGW